MRRALAKLPALRSTYRHGDLRQALLDAGIALARLGGPDAVVLREATRRSGVVPNAAYRHYASRSDLLQAVRAAALVAVAVAMQAELSKVRRTGSAADQARAAVRAVGAAYLKFAQSEPGLFRTAFSVPDELLAGVSLRAPEPSSTHPFALLGATLDRLVDAGVLNRARRPGAEYLAWSAVHGLAMLVLDGPLRSFTRARVRSVGQRVLEMVEKGLA